MERVLEVNQLTKQYGEYLALDHVSFHINKGEIVGFLGPNGAGKTTTIQMLMGLTRPDAGEIKYFGEDFFTHRQSCLAKINFASAYSEVQGRITVEQNLYIYGMLYDVKELQTRIKEVLELMEISHLRNTLFWHLSSGQKTRVILAKALINRPQLLLMDEPTASLDPEIVEKILELVQRLQTKEGVSILYTSHQMAEVTRICDRVLFLQSGKVVLEDTPRGLISRLDDSALIITFEGEAAKIKKYAEEQKIGFILTKKNQVELKSNDEKIPSILFDLKKLGIFVKYLDIRKPSLEDVFLKVAREQK